MKLKTILFNFNGQLYYILSFHKSDFKYIVIGIDILVVKYRGEISFTFIILLNNKLEISHLISKMKNVEKDLTTTAESFKDMYDKKEKTLNISDKPISDLSGLKERNNPYLNATSFIAQRCPLASLTGAELLVGLLVLDISGTQIKSLANLKFYKRLLHLRASNTPIESLKGMEACYALFTLDVSGCQIKAFTEIQQV